jgi:hypothetical protein
LVAITTHPATEGYAEPNSAKERTRILRRMPTTSELQMSTGRPPAYMPITRPLAAKDQTLSSRSALVYTPCKTTKPGTDSYVARTIENSPRVMPLSFGFTWLVSGPDMSNDSVISMRFK